MKRRPSGRAVRPARIATSILALACALPLVPCVHSHPGIPSQIEDLTRQIAAAPENAALYLQRGELRRLHREWKAAEADYGRCLRLDPDLAGVDLGLGRMYLESGRPAEALAPLDRYLAGQPGDGAALAIRGRAHADHGAHRAAAADFDRAIAAYRAQGSRPPPDLFLDRARSLTAAGDGRGIEALRGLDEGLALLGNAVTLELEAIEIELSLDRFDAALARVDRHLDNGRRSGPWLMKRGAILEQAGRHGAAAGVYRQALEAFETLPASRRSTPAAARRIEEIRTALRRVEGRTAEAGTKHGDKATDAGMGGRMP